MPTKQLLIKTYAISEGSNGDCDFARVSIDEEYAKTILDRRALFKLVLAKDTQLSEMSFWDAGAHYHSRYEDDPFSENVLSALGKMDDDNYAEVDANMAFGDTETNVELDRMSITADGVEWTASPAHTDILVTTLPLPYSVVEECLPKKGDPLVIEPRRLAYTAVMIGTTGKWGLGIAEANVAGYSPIKGSGPYPTMGEAEADAWHFNERLGLTKQEAFTIVASSLGAQNREEEEQRHRERKKASRREKRKG